MSTNELTSIIRSRARDYAFGIILIWLGYVLLTMFAPDNGAGLRYHISAGQLNALKVSVLLPYLVIWVATMFAIERFRSYTAIVKGSPEEAGFKNLTRGLSMLLLVVMLPVFIRSIATYYPDVDSVQKSIVIITNYATVVLYVLAFWFLLQASKAFVDTVDVAGQYKGSRTITPILIGILGIAYVWAIFHNPTRTTSIDSLIKPTYYLADWLIIATIALPYIIMWLWGSMAIINIRAYAKHVPGSIYKRAFNFVAVGMITIIGLSIALQFISQLGAYFGHASLGVILVIVYLIFLAMAAGHLLIARGAKELTAIESV